MVFLYFLVFDGLFLNLCKIWYTLITIYTLIYIYISTDNIHKFDKYVHSQDVFLNTYLCTSLYIVSFSVIHSIFNSQKNTSPLPCTKIHTRRLHFHVRLMMIIYPFEGSICIFFLYSVIICAIKLENVPAS